MKVLQLDTESVSTLISTGQLFSPSFVRLGISLEFFIHASSNKAAIRHIVRIVVDRVVKFKFLLMPTGFGHHVKFPSLQYITCESFNHLILWWHVHFSQSFLELPSHLGDFPVKCAYFGIFGFNQEPQIAWLILQLPICSLPLQVHLLWVLVSLNYIEVQLIVFLSKSLIFFLQGRQWLLIEFVLCLWHVQLILRSLVSLSHFEQLR